MPGKARIFKALLETLKSPSARSAVVRAEKDIIARRGAESASIAGMAGKGAIGLVSPGARKAIEKSTGKAYTKARMLDEAVAGRIARVPYLGAPFRGKQRAARRVLEKTPRGEVAEVVEVPTASLLEPVSKAQRVAVPIAAYMGIESLTREARRGERQMEPKYGQVMKAASVVIQRQDDEIKHRTVAMAKLADGHLALEHEKNATNFAVELLERGIIDKDGLREKIAELKDLTPEDLELEKKALNYIDAGASRLGVAEAATKQASESEQENEALAYLADHVHQHGVREVELDDD